MGFYPILSASTKKGSYMKLKVVIRISRNCKLASHRLIITAYGVISGKIAKIGETFSHRNDSLEKLVDDKFEHFYGSFEHSMELLSKQVLKRYVSRCHRAQMNYGVHVSLALVQLSFSIWHILGSIALRGGANPLIFALYREILSSIFMGVFVVLRKVSFKVDLCDFNRFVFVGLSSFINIVGTAISLQYISPSRYSILQPSIPIMACLVSVLIGIEKLTMWKCTGILIAAGGAVLVEVFSEHVEYENNIILGTSLVLIQCFGMANVIVFQVPLIQKYDTALVTFVYYGMGTIITLLICIGRAMYFTEDDLMFSKKPMAWIAVVYSAFFATFLTYNVYSWAGKIVTPSIVTVYSTLQPVGTTILAFIFLGHLIFTFQIIGGLLVICGLCVTVYSQYREKLNIEVNTRVDPFIAIANNIQSKSHEEDGYVSVHTSDERNNATASTAFDSLVKLWLNNSIIASPLAFPN
eukprot:gene12921-27255_t